MKGLYIQISEEMNKMLNDVVKSIGISKSNFLRIALINELCKIKALQKEDEQKDNSINELYMEEINKIEKKRGLK